MKEAKIEVSSPPKESLVDKFTKVIKAGVDSTVPFAAVGTELLMNFIKMPYQKRSYEWQQEVTDALHELQGRGVDLDQLQSNEDFIDILFQAVPIALKHHQVEKRQALRAAILNAASQAAPDVSIQQMFLGCIDVFTIWHMRVLVLMSGAYEWFKCNSVDWPRLGRTGTVRRIICLAYPCLGEQRDFVECIWDDLFARSFVVGGRGILDKQVQYDVLRSGYTTSLGDGFISYITCR